MTLNHRAEARFVNGKTARAFLPITPSKKIMRSARSCAKCLAFFTPLCFSMFVACVNGGRKARRRILANA